MFNVQILFRLGVQACLAAVGDELSMKPFAQLIVGALFRLVHALA